MLLAGGWQGSRQLKILCGGEALSVDLASSWCVAVPALWNMYGPTETTIWSAVETVAANFQADFFGAADRQHRKLSS